ncbi:stress response translation initiation inhibitor YciH [Psychromonas sp. CD1]|uniref:stress response translation initiation inhibitor YciH n=1 Tax=Psychromonas sp. CD1 TaxID=1979839 RepID=UPI000B9B86D8|nr:stress response translation initiation inhibitor YciH [Psychromonas sp. CD1]
MNFSELNLVYSTDLGKIKKEKEKEVAPKSDGIVRLHRQSKGRKGKGVILIKGLQLDVADLKLLAKEIKKRCATGGAIKDFVIEIQGDDRELIQQLLEKKGYKVKFSGG